MNNKTMEQSKYMALTLSTLMMALSIILTRFATIYILNGAFRVSIGTLPIIVTGLILGPFWGGVVGGLSDLIGVMLFPHGPPHYGILLTSILIGVFAGICTQIFKKINVTTLLITIASITIVLECTLQTYWLSQLQGVRYLVLLKTRALPVMIQGSIVFIILLTLRPLMIRYKNKILK